MLIHDYLSCSVEIYNYPCPNIKDTLILEGIRTIDIRDKQSKIKVTILVGFKLRMTVDLRVEGVEGIVNGPVSLIYESLHSF